MKMPLFASCYKFVGSRARSQGLFAASIGAMRAGGEEEEQRKEEEGCLHL